MSSQTTGIYFFIATIVCGILGFCFLVVPVSSNPHLRHYKTSLKYLAAAYISLALADAFFLSTNQEGSFTEFLSFPNLLIASLQSLLLTYSIITLFDYKYVSTSRIKTQFTPVVLLLVLFIVANFITKDPKFPINQYFKYLHFPTVIVRTLYFLFYIYQLIYFTILFFRVEKEYDKKINDYFSETISLRMTSVRISFIGALLVGLFSLLLHFFPTPQFNIAFIVFYTTFYLGFALVYINYNYIFNRIEPALEYSETTLTLTPYNNPKPQWAEIKEQILSQKIYSKQGITLDEMSRLVGIERADLSSFLAKEEEKTFSNWVNWLRIEEGKRILKDEPNYTLIKVSSMLGFSEQSNFSKQFKLLTGCSPSVWRQGKQK